MPPIKNKYILCADDFGFTEGISNAILDLCQSKKLNAASVMVESRLIGNYAPLLTQYSPHIQIGLHFNLTESLSQKAFSLSSLIFSFRLCQKKKKQIADRLKIQLDLFEKLFNRPPDFIDGHQHVHILPAVRTVFLDIIQYRYGNLKDDKPWIRQVSPPLTHTDTYLKVVILNLLNIGFRRLCTKHKFRYNQSFDGVYSLTPTVRYVTLLQAWLNRSANGSLIMCHPSADIDKTDVISEARLQEYNVLKQR